MLHHRLRGADNILRYITKISTVTSSSSNITVMSGVQSGDLLVLFDAGYLNTSGTISNVIPSGFTSIGTITYQTWVPTENYLITTVSYKIANGTESGTTVTGINTFSEAKKLILYRGNKSISTVTTKSVVSQSDDRGPLSRTITSSSGLTPLIIFANRVIIHDGDYEDLSYTGETPVIDNGIYYTIKNKNETINNVSIGVAYNSLHVLVVMIGFYLELE